MEEEEVLLAALRCALLVDQYSSSIIRSLLAVLYRRWM